MDGSNLGEKKKYNLAALAKSKLETTTFIGSLTPQSSVVDADNQQGTEKEVF